MTKLSKSGWSGPKLSKKTCKILTLVLSIALVLGQSKINCFNIQLSSNVHNLRIAAILLFFLVYSIPLSSIHLFLIFFLIIIIYYCICDRMLLSSHILLFIYRIHISNYLLKLSHQHKWCLLCWVTKQMQRKLTSQLS